MSAIASRALVIDASVARAAGGENATAPSSTLCRDFLIATLQICHRIVMSKAIAEEWKKHQSNFARTWLRSMYARKKVVPVAGLVDSALREAINASRLSGSEQETMLKDVHLVEAAHESGMAVVSADDTVRVLFKKSSSEIAKFRAVVWTNPTNGSENVIEWLRAGAPDEDRRALGTSK